MPQGGIDTGETLRQAALRELKEEVGSDRVEVLAECRGWFHHDVPDEIAQVMMGARYRGNCQKWFAMRFTGMDADINHQPRHGASGIRRLGMGQPGASRSRWRSSRRSGLAWPEPKRRS
jgi:hypothetical protein